MTCFNLSGFYWVQTIIERDSCAITYYRGVEWRKMSGVKNIIFRCYILLFSTDGWGGLMYFSISLHILCEVPRSFSPNSYSVYGERPYVYCKRLTLSSNLSRRWEIKYSMISNKIFKSSQRGYHNKRRHFTEAQVKAKQVKCVQPKSQMVKNHKLSSHAMLAKKY